MKLVVARNDSGKKLGLVRCEDCGALGIVLVKWIMVFGGHKEK